jgi:hypothetical protein
MKKIPMTVLILTISGVAFAAYTGNNGEPVAITELLTASEAGALFLFSGGFVGLVGYRRTRRMK